MASFLELLSPELKSQLIKRSQKRSLTANQMLFQRGDQASHMYLVEKGRILLFRNTSDGEEKVFKEFMANDVIAETAMFMSPSCYPMNARAISASTVIAFSNEDIHELVAEYPELALRTLANMSNRIHELMDRVDTLTQVNAGERLVMRLAEWHRHQKNPDSYVSVPISKKVMATQLGIKPETLSRLLTKMKQSNLIVEKGVHWYITDKKALCDSVGLLEDIFN